MKLRSTHNSIRLRLRKSDLATLAKRNAISESIHFPAGNTLQFWLKIDAKKTAVAADFIAPNLTIYLPKMIAEKWINSEQVGIESYLTLNQSEQLHVLIEKDFPCKDRPDEDKADTFQELAKENTTC